MKLRKNNRIATTCLCVSFIFLMAFVFSKTNWFQEMSISWFHTFLIIGLWSLIIGMPLVVAFLKTKNIEIQEDMLRTYYILGLFTKKYDLDSISDVQLKITEIPNRQANTLALFGIKKIQKLTIEFKDGRKTTFDCNTLMKTDVQTLRSQLLRNLRKKSKV
jgi:hypothetical protein